MLAQHPYFTLHAIGASPKSSGKKYKDAVKWKQESSMSSEIAELVVRECTVENFRGCDLVFSGLDADVAGDIGTQRTLIQ